MASSKNQRPVDPNWVPLDEVTRVLGIGVEDKLYNEVAKRLNPDFDFEIEMRGIEISVSREFLAKFVKEDSHG